ncbi:MAG: hypothetical protein KME49_28135 [Brasilonema octagenarum HA4186-MV1]|jgi:hypothetical protein|nr:hypothetical protein [Brasilonema octagenarum HA4186-MV1]
MVCPKTSIILVVPSFTNALSYGWLTVSRATPQGQATILWAFGKGELNVENAQPR